MGRVRWLEPGEAARWDAFVERHPYGLVYHGSAWRQVLEECFRHIRGRFLVVEEEGEIIGGLPVYLVGSPLTGRRLVSVPFATFFDPLLTKEQASEVLPRLRGLCDRVGATFVEIRTWRNTSALMGEGWGDAAPQRHHWLSLEPGEERLRERFHRSVRRGISKTEKDGVLSLRVGRDKEDLWAFYRLFRGTRRRLSLPPLPYRFFESLWNHLAEAGHAAILLAMQGKRPVGGILCLRFKGLFTTEYVGDEEKVRAPLRVNHFLYWQAICMACREGDHVFSFGRTSRTNEGLLLFKARWATQADDLHDLYHPPELARAVGFPERSWKYRLVKEISRRLPQGLSDLWGAWIYRHMG